MKPTKQSKPPIQNSYLLNICAPDGKIVRVIEIDAKEVFLMKEAITDIFENYTGGVTIRLSLKSKYIKDELSN
jgi:hypothetical protein